MTDNNPISISAKKNVMMPISLIVALVVFTSSMTLKASGAYTDLKQTDVDLAKSVEAISQNNSKVLTQLQDYDERVRSYIARVERLEMKDEYDERN